MPEAEATAAARRNAQSSTDSFPGITNAIASSIVLTW